MVFMSEPLKEKIVELLEAHYHTTIALTQPDGSPQAVIVSYANKGTTLYFGTDAQATKVGFLKLNNKVSLTIFKDWDDWGKVQALSISGYAERVDDLAEFEEARKLILNKFSGVAHYKPEDPETAVFFRISPIYIRVFDYTQGIGHQEVYEV